MVYNLFIPVYYLFTILKYKGKELEKEHLDE